MLFVVDDNALARPKQGAVGPLSEQEGVVEATYLSRNTLPLADQRSCRSRLVMALFVASPGARVMAIAASWLPRCLNASTMVVQLAASERTLASGGVPTDRQLRNRKRLSCRALRELSLTI